jgi:iron complex transport system substrate-binding protein
VGDFLTPNIEAIAATRPTLVIGLISSSDQRQFRALRAMGYRTLLVTGDDSLTEIEDQIRQIGDAIGRHDEAQRLVGAIRMRIESIEERLRGVSARRVLMVVGHQPMVAVGQGTYLDDLLKLAHAANIADASGQTWPRLSIEYIIATRPEVIIDGQMGTDPTTPDAFWGEYATIPAVRNHRVNGYPEDPTLHPGPRVAQSLEILARLIHPEAFQREAYNQGGAAGIAARSYGTHDVTPLIGAGSMPRVAQ